MRLRITWGATTATWMPEERLLSRGVTITSTWLGTYVAVASRGRGGGGGEREGGHGGERWRAEGANVLWISNGPRDCPRLDLTDATVCVRDNGGMRSEKAWPVGGFVSYARSFAARGQSRRPGQAGPRYWGACRVLAWLG